MLLKPLGLGLLALMLAGCGTVRPPEVQVLVPPAALLQDCVYVAPPLRTNGELVQAYVALQGVLALCNDDKEALREWAQRLKGTQ
jgi:hypothetical protein